MEKHLERAGAEVSNHLLNQSLPLLLFLQLLKHKVGAI